MMRRLFGASAIVAVSLLAACAHSGSSLPPRTAAPGGITPESNVMRGCEKAVPAGQGRCLVLIRTDIGGGNPRGYHGLYRGRTVSRRGTTSPESAPGMPPGYGPSDLQSAYNLTSSSSSVGGGQTIAVVDLFDDPNAESDLAVYRSTYGLPACTTANGCFKKVNQQGVQGNYPGQDANWDAEISLDVDMVSAICPNCRILLVEVDPFTSSLGVGVDTAVQLGANTISTSFGTPEAGGGYDSHYDHPGHIITAATGDGTYSAGLSAPSVYGTVVAVGGTSLMPASNARGWTETVWDGRCQRGTVICGTVSGCTADVAKPAWQTDAGCPRRMVADVAAVGDPGTGVAVYDSIPYNGAVGWQVDGGTSASSPIVAAIYGLAGAESSLNYAQSLYGSAFLNDVTVGNDGSCAPAPAYFCTAGPGYDGPSGNGTPNGIGAFQPPFQAQSLSIGPDGTVWILGGYSSSNLTNIYKYSGGALQQIAGSATEIAVDSAGAPWVVNGSGGIYHYNAGSNSFAQIPGGATEIATGPNGAMWVVGTDANGSAGNHIYQYNGSAFNQSPGAATDLAVDQNGFPWVVNSANQIFQYTSSTANVPIPGAASQVAIGLNGGIWCLGVDVNGFGHSIYHYNGSFFTQVPGQATEIAVDQTGAAWVINSAGSVYRYDTPSGSFQAVPGL